MGFRVRITSNLVKFSFRLERLFPQFIKFFINRKLKEYKNRGLISAYKVKAKRRGKYRYSFNINLLLVINNGGEKSE